MPQDNPLAKLGGDNPLSALGPVDITSTAVGRQQYRARSIEENLAKLREARSKATDPDNQRRLDAFIADLERQKGGNWTRGSEKSHGDVSNAIRGVGAGIAGAAPSFADLALTIPDLLGFESADEARRYLRENQETTKEFFDPGGKAGLAGEVAGGVAGSAIPFGGTASVVGKGVTKALGAGEAITAAKAAKSAVPRIAAHVAENVAGGAPLNALQSLGMKESETSDKLKQFGINELGDVAFGVAQGARAPKGEVKATVKPIEGAPTAPQGKSAAAQQAADLVAKGEARKQARQMIDQIVQSEWEKANPNTPWEKLNRQAKIDFKNSIGELIAKRQAELSNQPPPEGGSEGESGGATPAVVPPVQPPGGAGSVVKGPVGVEEVSQVQDPMQAKLEALKAKMNASKQAKVDSDAIDQYAQKLADMQYSHKEIKDALKFRFNLHDAIADAAASTVDYSSHPDLQEDSISKDWNRTHPDQRALYVGDENKGLNWKDLPDQARQDALEMIKMEREDDIRAGIKQVPMEDVSDKLHIDKHLDYEEASGMSDPIYAQWEAWYNKLNKEQKASLWANRQNPGDNIDHILKLNLHDLHPDDRKWLINNAKKAGLGPTRESSDLSWFKSLDELSNNGISDENIHQHLVEDKGLSSEEALNLMADWHDARHGSSVDGEIISHPDGPIGMRFNDSRPEMGSGLSTHSVEDELRKPSFEEGQRVPDDIKGELTDILIDYHTQHWIPDNLNEKLDDFAARNEVTRDQVDQTLKDLGLDQHANQNFDKGTNPLEPSGTKPEPSTISPPGQEALPTGPSQTPDLSLATSEELDAAKEELLKAIEANPNDANLHHQLDLLAAETRSRDQVRLESEAAIRDANDQFPDAMHDPTVTKLPPKPQAEPEVTRIDPAEFGKLARSSPSKLTDAQLDAVIDETVYRIQGGTEGPEFDATYKKLQDKFLAEKAKRRPPSVDLNMPPGLGGTILGAFYGIVTQEDTDDPSRILMWAAAGGLGAYGASKVWNTWELNQAIKKQNAKPEMYPGQHQMPKFIQYQADVIEKKNPLMVRARHYYSGLVRGTGGGEDIATKLGGNKLPHYQNFSSLASLAGRWVDMAERWMTVQPEVIGDDGNPVALDAKSLASIKDIAQGDIENLDELAVASTTLENYGKPGWKPPIDLARAQLIYTNAPQHLHEAATELRKYFLGLADVLVNSGVLSQQTREKFAQEAYYTALHRVVGEGEAESWIAKKLKKAEVINSLNPVQPRKGGSTLKVKSPFEIAADMTKSYLRAAEFNKAKIAYMAFAKAQPPEIRATLFARADKKAAPVLSQVNYLADQIRDQLPSMSAEDSQRLAAGFGGKLDNAASTMTMYEEGVLRTYKINDAAFDLFKHMMPSELNAALYFIGGPTRLAAKGIVYNPAFVGTMEFINTFQVALQSKYGFVPFVDSFKGWWAAMSQSPQYQKLMAAGGPSTIQGLSAVDRTTSRAIIQAAGKNPVQTAFNLAKELHPWEAYKALVLPFGEASKIGEGLRALNHGASTVDAVYAAWHGTGNMKMQGNFAAMRAFNLLTLFSRPAISAIDEAVVKSGLHPFRAPTPSNSWAAGVLKEMGFKSDRAINGIEFAAKGFGYLTIPTAMLWYLGKDDPEIQQLRQTEAGRRYWWYRAGDQLLKVRKPQVIGQLFGSTVEDLLDKQYAANPSSASWIGGLVNDAAFNVLPQFGVVPLSLWANKQVGLGSPIVPEADGQLLPSMQGELNASNPARVVAKGLSKVSDNLDPGNTVTAGLRTAMSPAGLDFVVNSTFGMLGQDGLRTVDWFVNQQKLNLPPATSELPLVGRLFGKYPSMNTRSVRDFYQQATQVEEIQRSFNELLTHKPQFATQFQVRHKQELMLAPIFQDQRQTISEFRRMIEDSKFMLSNGQMTAEQFKRVEAEMLRRITQVAQMTVEQVRKYK